MFTISKILNTKNIKSIGLFMKILDQSKIRHVIIAKEKQFLTRKCIAIETAKASFLLYN